MRNADPPELRWKRWLLIAFMAANLLGSLCAALILTLGWAVALIEDGSNTNGPAAAIVLAGTCLLVSLAQLTTLLLTARAGLLSHWWAAVPLLQLAAALALLATAWHLESQLTARYG